MPSYFTGRSVHDKTLIASEATTFRDLVNRSIDNPLRLAITYAEYHQLKTREEDMTLSTEERAKAKKERARAKQVPYLVACTFPESPWQGRLFEHAKDCNLLFLDVDDRDDAARIIHDSSGLDRFNHVIYRTITSTPEHPRVRVMVDAQAVPVDRYADALATIAKCLKLPQITRESKVVVQPMYRPAVFSDQDADLEHPVIKTLFSGATFTATDITATDAAATGTPTESKPDDLLDYLLYFKEPLSGVSVEKIAEALNHISPDLSYPEWVQIGMALRHQFQSSPEEGFDIFNEWSAKGAKYSGLEDMQIKWSQLHEQPKGRCPVTIRTVFKLAQEAGWSADTTIESLYDDYIRWLGTVSRQQAMSASMRKLASIPLLSSVEKESLITHVVNQLRDQFGVKVGESKLRQQLKEECNRLKALQAEKPQDEQAPAWARGLCYVAAGNEIIRPRTRQIFSMEAFDRVYGRKLLPSPDKLVALGREVNEFSLNTPLFKPTDYALNHIKCQTADDYLYDPTNPDETYTKHGGKIYVNTYIRDYRTSDPASSAYAEDIVLDHMHNLFTDPDHVEAVLDWKSFQVQHPGIKIRYALFVQGAKGCGKSLLAEIMRVCLGESNVKVINQQTFGKGWNEWATGSQLVAIEEIRAKGHNRHDTMEILKEPITNDYISINERGVSTRTVRNFTNYLIFSNWQDALAVTEDERRYLVLKSKMQKREQVEELRAKDPLYFTRIVELLRIKPGGIRHFLENRTIRDSFNPNGPPPETVFLKEMIEDTSSELATTIRQIIMEKENPAVSKEIIAANVLRSCLMMHELDDVSSTYLATTLREMGYTKLDQRHTINGDKQYVWVRPDIAGPDAVNILNKHLDEQGQAVVEM